MNSSVELNVNVPGGVPVTQAKRKRQVFGAE